MSKKIFLSSTDCYKNAESIAWAIIDSNHYKNVCQQNEKVILYGVPRGGVPASYLVMAKLKELLPTVFTIDCTMEPKTLAPDFIIDDIIDSGATRNRVLDDLKIGDERFFALIDREKVAGSDWFVFPWEGTEKEETSAEDIPLRFLQYIGETPTRDGLQDTPKRVVRSWNELYAGYRMNPEVILSRAFENTQGYDEMVILRDIEFYSMCEHHVLPFYGKVHIAYLPKDKVVGISKLARLVECYARRLQIQEAMTQQIANAIELFLQPVGVAVLVEAQHFCMVARGVQKQNSVMITSALKGNFRNQEARMEFLLLRGRQ